MATNLAISRAQYETASNAIAVILSAYSGSRNSLKSIYLQKRRLGTLAGSQIFRDYKMLLRKEIIVEKYEESLVQNVERYPHCNNCNRFLTNAELEDLNGSTGNPYYLILRDVQVKLFLPGTEQINSVQNNQIL